MKIVFDTNVIIAAFIAQGYCHEVFEYACLHHTIIMSPHILGEEKKNLQKKFHFSVQDTQQVIHFITEHSTQVKKVSPLKKSACRDKTDDAILALAFQEKADLICTGDKDLLILQSYEHIPIVLPRDFWKSEAIQQVN